MRKLKAYIKPIFECYTLTVEEKFAGGSVCTVTGCCPDQYIAKYEASTGIKVNYSAGF